MKKQFFFSMLAATAMLVSCSSEDAVVDNSEVKAGEEGYIAFNIQLPQTSLTRANDEFDDGLAAEYAVKNGYIVLFQGASESAATFCGAYQLNGTFNTVGTTTDQCTSEGIMAAAIDKPASTDVYAYVILNNNGLLAGPSKTGVTIGSTPVTDATDFEKFSKIVMNNIGDLTNGMLMTNCPVSSKIGGASDPSGANITTLTKLDMSRIYATEAKAKDNPAGDVFVERAAAKVTVKASSLSGSTSSGVNYDASTITWALANENQVYYNTRQMSPSWLGLTAINAAPKNDGTIASATKYRFVSGGNIHPDVFRTYWGTDLNYNAEPSTGNFFKTNPTITDMASATVLTTTGNDVYTFENTFDVNHQSSKNTTQATFAVTFNNGEKFYTTETYGSEKILQVPTWSGSEEKVQDYIMKYLNANSVAFKSWYDTKPENRIKVTMDDLTGAKLGWAEVASVATESGADALATPITETELKTLINTAMKFKVYADGIAYYHTKIKHFGSEQTAGTETPWTETNHKVNDIANIYKKIGSTTLTNDEADQNYLGRYGILRNNWYQVEVTAIRKIGDPVPGDPNNPGSPEPGQPTNPDNPWTPDNPDDEVENYIAVKIHITPWALRKQRVIL